MIHFDVKYVTPFKQMRYQQDFASSLNNGTIGPRLTLKFNNGKTIGHIKTNIKFLVMKFYGRMKNPMQIER